MEIWLQRSNGEGKTGSFIFLFKNRPEGPFAFGDWSERFASIDLESPKRRTSLGKGQVFLQGRQEKNSISQSSAP